MNDHFEVLARLAAELHMETQGETAESILDKSRVLVASAEHVSITVRARRGWFRTLASSSSLAASLDELQYEIGEGPCLDTALHAGWHRSGDLATEVRWPRWGRAAADAGARSSLSVTLLEDDRPFGALNMYHPSAGRFVDVEERDTALLWSTHVASALARVQKIEGLQTALATRHTIGMAQGILMERFDIDADAAFRVLARHSSHLNRRLSDVAEEVVNSHALPEVPGLTRRDGGARPGRPGSREPSR